MATANSAQGRKTGWTLVSFAAAAAVFGAGLASHGFPHSWTTIAIYAGLLLGSGNFVLELPSQASISPSTILLMGAVASVPRHDELLAALICGACDGIEWKRLRARRYQIVILNASQVALSCAAAAEFYQHSAFSLPLRLAGTTVAYEVANVALVLGGMAIMYGRFPTAMLADVGSSLATDIPFALLGLATGILYTRYGLVVIVVALAPLAIGATVYRSTTKFRHAYSRLESLYDFTRRLDAERDGSDPASDMLKQVCGLLGVFGAEVTVLDQEGWHRAVLPDSVGPLVREDGVGSAPPHYVTEVPFLASSLDPESPSAHSLKKRGMADGMIAPLRVDGRLIGSIAVTGTVNLRPLKVEDLRLLETLANHVAVFLERNRLVERLRHESTHDQLTGLPNRRRFNDVVASAARPTAIMLIDLDRFKEVNDTLGHEQGDLLLVSVANRLREEFNGSVVARLGGDEFGVLLPPHLSGDATQAAVSMLTLLEHPFSVGVLDLEVTASIGVAVADDDSTADKLLQQADVAMYSAKEAHSGWEIYSPGRDHHSPWRLSLASDLRRGITAGELEVHFQPKSRLDDGSVCGLEALVRWRHPRYGLLSPDQFIPVAEQAGLIRPLTMSVLASSCEEQTRLREFGFSLDIAINLSVRSVLDVNLPDQIDEVLSQHGVTPRSLTLEITEGSLMADPTRTIGVLGRLSSLGIAISIDDFGTGYSSLGYLRRLPATEVKIDRSFVTGMLSNPSDDAIVRSTVELAHNLGLRAVAEGVEDPETWARLSHIGCDEGQGYFLSAPLTSEALLPWLLRTRSTYPQH